MLLFSFFLIFAWFIRKFYSAIYIDSLNINPNPDGSFGNPYGSISQALNFSENSSSYDFEILSDGDLKESQPLGFFSNLSLSVKNLSISYTKLILLNNFSFLAQNESFMQINKLYFIFDESHISDAIFILQQGSLLLLEDCIFNLSNNALFSKIFSISNSEVRLVRILFNVKNNNGNFKYIFILESISIITLDSVIFNEFENNTGLILLASNSSKTFIQNTIVNKSKFNTGAGVFKTNYQLIVNNLTFIDSILVKVSFFFFFKNEVDINSPILANFTKLLFSNITQNDSTFKNSILIHSPFKNFYFVIDSSSFQKIYSYTEMIFIQGSYLSFSISNSLFDSNYAYGLITLTLVAHVKIENVSVINQNNQNIKQNSNIFQFLRTGGTCFRIYNCLHRELINLTITDSFSNYTAIGFQIIDDSEFPTFLNSNGNLTESNITIDKSYFSNNFVFYDANLNSSGVFYFDTDCSIFLFDNYFFNNSINSTSSPPHKIGGPCINSFSESNNLRINRSIFGANRAKYTSNCLFFTGVSLNITNSYFFNNNPIYDIVEEKAYAQFSLTFTRKLESHVNANGGALLSRANILYVSDCFFFNNSNYRGGGIHIESSEFQHFVAVYICKNVFSTNIVGTLGGGIAFGLTKNLTGLVQSNLFENNDAKYGACVTTEYSSRDNYVLINSSSFYSNTAEYGGGIIGHHIGGTIDIRGCIFSNNYAKKIPGRVSPIAGGAFVIWGGIFTFAFFSNNVYSNNKADIQGGAGVLYGGETVMSNEHFINNTVFYNGILSIGFQAILRLNNSIMENEVSTYKSSGIWVNEFSNVYIYNLTIINGFSPEKAGALEISETVNFYGEQVIIKNCFSNRGSALLVFEGNTANVTFKDCVFEENSALISIIEIETTLIMFINCIFTGNTNSVFILEDSNFTVISSKIENLKCSETCFTLSSTNSFVNIENSSFQEIYSGSEDHSFYLYYTQARLENSTFSNISQVKGSFLAANTELNGSNLRFFNNFPSVAYIRETVGCFKNVIFENLMDQHKKEFNSFLFLINLQYVSINNCLFLNNIAASEGCGINAISTNFIGNNQSLILNGSNFTSSHSNLKGGALFLSDISIQITGCYFFNNSALEGGAIYYKTSREESNSSFKIENSIFENNEALMGGGAIMWVHKMPEISIKTILFINNIAKYGNNIVSNVMRIGVKILDFNQTSNSFITIFDSMRDSLNFSIKNQKAGNRLNKTVVFSFIDYYNQTVGSLDKTLESFDLFTENQFTFFLNTGIQLPENMDNLAVKTFIGAAKAFPIKEGILSPEDMEIYAKPDSSVYLFFKPASLSSFSRNLKGKIPFEYEINKEYYIIIKIQVSKCELGEITRDNTCYACEYSQYSLNINDTNCKKCPKGAFCKGKAEFIVKDGFWRDSNLTDKVIDCQPCKSNCKGGLVSSCSDFFYGPLCRTCPARYYNINNQFCLYCEDQIWNVFRVIGMMIVLFVAITFLIKSTFDNNVIFDKLRHASLDGIINEHSLIHYIDLQSFYIKILVNWIQLSSLLYIIPLDWPDYVMSFFSTFSFFSSISTRFMAFECLFSQDGYGDWKPYVRPLAVNIMPFFLILMTLITWRIYQKLKREKEIYDKIFASLLGIYMMMQQNILNECVNSLSCIELNGVNVLKNDPLYSCDSSLHLYMKAFFLWPMFLLWSFLLPFIILAYLFKNRNKLYEAKVFKKMNFFYIGYRSKFFYWDILILLRKSLSIFINLFAGSTLNFELMVLILLMSLYFKYLVSNKPFLGANLNFLEILATSVGILGIFLALLINMLLVDSERIIFYVVILILNGFFIAIWSAFFFFYLLITYRRLLQKKYPKILEKLKKFLAKFKVLTPVTLKITDSTKQSGSLTQDWKRNLSSMIYNALTFKGRKMTNSNQMSAGVRHY